jgi:hypothetical protein
VKEELHDMGGAHRIKGVYHGGMIRSHDVLLLSLVKVRSTLPMESMAPAATFRSPVPHLRDAIMEASTGLVPGIVLERSSQ